MATVNDAVRAQMERMGPPLVLIDTGAPSLDRSPAARLARLPKALHGMLRLAIGASRGETLYMSVSGGIGQLYELLFLLLARFHCMRIFLHHHSYAYLDRHNMLTSLLLSVAGSGATHIVLSAGMAGKLKRTYHHANRVVAISNVALLMENAAPSVMPRHALGKIGFLGNIAEEKGICEFLSVAEKLEAIGIPVRAVLAGPFQDSGTERMVRERLTRLSSVEYAGPIYGPNKTEFFHGIDVLLFPTRYANEAEPLTIHEAMMHGIPIIAYGRGAIGEIISPDCGLVVDPAMDFVDPAVAQLRFWSESPQALRTASQAAHERFQAISVEYRKQWESMRAELCA